VRKACVLKDRQAYTCPKHIKMVLKILGDRKIWVLVLVFASLS